MSGQLTDGFRDIIELRWSEFVAMEESLDATNFDSIITAIARAAKKSNLRAIQAGLDRLDGKIAMEIKAEYPKFYTIFPYATKTAVDPSIIDLDEIKASLPSVSQGRSMEEMAESVALAKDVDFIGAPADVEELANTEEELPTGSLRIVLEKMLHSPKSIVSDIIAASDAVDAGDMTHGDPMVKSVFVAGLMKLVHDGKMSAVFEVFDQIDGKVAETIKVLGQDVYVTRFDAIAPADAVKNEKGVYQIESEIMTDVWATRLEQLTKGKR